jgi:sarcosine oxidase
VQNQAAVHYDVIVIGVGSMGSSACWFLAQRGYTVLGLEQFEISHEKGSHTGQSRIIRKAYFEHPDYVPLLEHAYENWRAFENETGAVMYEQTGIVYMGDPETETMKGIRESAFLHSVSIKYPSLTHAREQFPAFRIPGNFQVIVEPDSGFVTPERAISMYASEAVKKGAVIKTNEPVTEWKQEAGIIKVTGATGEYTCDKLIITAGSWASKIIPTLPTELKVTKQMLAWVNPKKREPFLLGNFPCWFIQDPELGLFYGFPVLPEGRFGGPAGLKLAHHFPGEISDPDHVSKEIPANTEENIRHILSKYIPDADGPVIDIKTCLYTYSRDEHFIIDHLPGSNQRVTVACGFSGHGFKFAPVVGEVLADLAMKGKTDLPVGFLSLDRFHKM